MATLNFAKAERVWDFTWDVDWVTAVRFIGSSRRLAAGNNLGQILVWELPEDMSAPAPLPIQSLAGHDNRITRLQSNGDGQWLISASYDHTIRCWNMKEADKTRSTVVLNSREITDYEARQRRGRARGDAPKPVETEVDVRQASRTLAGHDEWINGLALSHDEKLLLSGDDKGQVIAWDWPGGKERNRWPVTGWAQALAIAPDNKQLAVSERLPVHPLYGRHLGMKIRELATGKVQHDLSKAFKSTEVAAAAYSTDGKLLALGEAEGGNHLWLFDPTSGKKVRELTPAHSYGVTDLAFHPDGKHLASSGRDTKVRIWNLDDGKLVAELGKSRGTSNGWDWLHAISFSADGLWLAAADMGGKVQVWSLGS